MYIKSVFVLYSLPYYNIIDFTSIKADDGSHKVLDFLRLKKPDTSQILKQFKKFRKKRIRIQTSVIKMSTRKRES